MRIKELVDERTKLITMMVTQAIVHYDIQLLDQAKQMLAKQKKPLEEEFNFLSELVLLDLQLPDAIKGKSRAVRDLLTNALKFYAQEVNEQAIFQTLEFANKQKLTLTIHYNDLAKLILAEAYAVINYLV